MSTGVGSPPPGGSWGEAVAAARMAKAISEAHQLIEEARALQRRSALVRQRSIDLHNAWHHGPVIGASWPPVRLGA